MMVPVAIQIAFLSLTNCSLIKAIPGPTFASTISVQNINYRSQSYFTAWNWNITDTTIDNDDENANCTIVKQNKLR